MHSFVLGLCRESIDSNRFFNQCHRSRTHLCMHFIAREVQWDFVANPGRGRARGGGIARSSAPRWCEWIDLRAFRVDDMLENASN
jgi:hypothetical protein